MTKYLCDSCKRNNGTVIKTYADASGAEHREEYVSCQRRWTRSKIPELGYCFDYKERKTHGKNAAR